MVTTSAAIKRTKNNRANVRTSNTKSNTPAFFTRKTITTLNPIITITKNTRRRTTTATIKTSNNNTSRTTRTRTRGTIRSRVNISTSSTNTTMTRTMVAFTSIWANIVGAVEMFSSHALFSTLKRFRMLGNWNWFCELPYRSSMNEMRITEVSLLLDRFLLDWTEKTTRREKK